MPYVLSDLGCRVRGIVSRNRHGAELQQMRIVRGIQGEYSFALGEGVFAQLLGLAAFFSVGDEEAVGEFGNIGVALGCDICGGARMLSSKKDRSRRRPSASGFCQAFGIRMVPRPRAGQTTTDEGPRNTKSRKSFSIGDWNPPMRVKSVFRSARARS